MNPIAQRLRSLAARTALDGIAEEMRAIADEITQQAQEPVWANDYVTKVHAQIEHLLNDLITTQVSCNLPYYGVKTGMLTNNWVSALKRLHAEYPSPPAPQVPVDELPDLNPEDIVVDVVLKQLGGFAPVTTHGVRVTHKPSRVSVVVDSERSQHRNRQLALEALRSILAMRPAVEPMTPEQWCEVLGTAGVDLLELAKMWSDNKIHVYQFTNEAEKIVKAAVLRGITAKAEGVRDGRSA